MMISPAKLDPKWGVIAGYEAKEPIQETILNKSHLNFDNLIDSRPLIEGRGFLAFNSAFGNYYHILMEWLPTFLEFVELSDPDATLILPSSQQHNEALNAALDMLNLRSRSQFIDDSSSNPIAFSHLYYSDYLHGSHNYSPSQFTLAFFKDLAQTVNKFSNTGASRLYISRSDSRNRIMENESELISELCMDHGFAALTISNMPFPIIVNFFMSAKVIVAPHGAGLVNLVFKGESNRFVCELQPESYKNPCFKVLSSALGDSYSAISLTDVSSDHHQHLLRTRIDEDAKNELRVLLDGISQIKNL